MVKEAQSHSEDDKKKRELVDVRNQVDSVAYGLEKTLKENRDKVPEADAQAVEEALAAARKAAEGEDAAAIRAAGERLTELGNKVAEALYQNTTSSGRGQAAQPDHATGKPEGDVVDAEYTVKE
jgi:molecular chaperone DnaK